MAPLLAVHHDTGKFQSMTFLEAQQIANYETLAKSFDQVHKQVHTLADNTHKV